MPSSTLYSEQRRNAPALHTLIVENMPTSMFVARQHGGASAQCVPLNLTAAVLKISGDVELVSILGFGSFVRSLTTLVLHGPVVDFERPLQSGFRSTPSRRQRCAPLNLHLLLPSRILMSLCGRPTHFPIHHPPSPSFISSLPSPMQPTGG
ncbi:hypothetical protein HYDPIDRAFT_117934 [Hydnomerulius pinastri MD-312]|uniref:Uncharacterized protein n=1 Tax=Hydnomerulius pinastri MD-312 TaxID=994086 RepID=A0A0C9V3F7_9AGAM|nr:hypothetical protein HYDPIDRAFT_117934 [Hydnomerulius pinastri MD-312]